MKSSAFPYHQSGNTVLNIQLPKYNIRGLIWMQSRHRWS